ncbi:hypothetical protein CYMTET_52126 [Cymbomonas tetramitiformis]|uniref:Uncharacterized protein n=1 Tax=Cymbomonas tetramitiformis TaxID=36881 RepID=A0AAE0BKT0_9CHLO|nr:hypothetical protein CYMTET_52126 [Cymbomonas tetramitiformis]
MRRERVVTCQAFQELLDELQQSTKLDEVGHHSETGVWCWIQTLDALLKNSHYIQAASMDMQTLAELEAAPSGDWLAALDDRAALQTLKDTLVVTEAEAEDSSASLMENSPASEEIADPQRMDQRRSLVQGEACVLEAKAGSGQAATTSVPNVTRIDSFLLVHDFGLDKEMAKPHQVQDAWRGPDIPMLQTKVTRAASGPVEPKSPTAPIAAIDPEVQQLYNDVDVLNPEGQIVANVATLKDKARELQREILRVHVLWRGIDVLNDAAYQVVHHGRRLSEVNLSSDAPFNEKKKEVPSAVPRKSRSGSTKKRFSLLQFTSQLMQKSESDDSEGNDESRHRRPSLTTKEMMLGAATLKSSQMLPLFRILGLKDPPVYQAEMVFYEALKATEENIAQKKISRAFMLMADKSALDNVVKAERMMAEGKKMMEKAASGMVRLEDEYVDCTALFMSETFTKMVVGQCKSTIPANSQMRDLAAAMNQMQNLWQIFRSVQTERILPAHDENVILTAQVEAMQDHLHDFGREALSKIFPQGSLVTTTLTCSLFIFYILSFLSSSNNTDGV